MSEEKIDKLTADKLLEAVKNCSKSSIEEVLQEYDKLV